MIVLRRADLSAQAPLRFVKVDQGDAYVVEGLGPKPSLERPLVTGSWGRGTPPSPGPEQVWLNADGDRVTAWVCSPAGVEAHEVSVVEVQQQLFARLRGLFETPALHSKRVLVFGLGSGGSPIALELAKAGVGVFDLVDFDRIEVGNVVRHVCGLSDVGRLKTRAVADLLQDKNPGAQVHMHPMQVGWDVMAQVRELVARADLVICATDNRASRMVVNRACVDAGVTCIYGGTFRRAYGGIVMRARPGEGPCYQCFVDILPEVAADREVSTQRQADALAYSDRPVPVEPGLSNDIAPLSTMCVRLAILELLRGTETSLSSLYQDLQSSVYQWLNRREAGTQYAGLEPLEDGPDFRILAWYPMQIDQDPLCPCCGTRGGGRAFEGLEPDADELALFDADPAEDD